LVQILYFFSYPSDVAVFLFVCLSFLLCFLRRVNSARAYWEIVSDSTDFFGAQLNLYAHVQMRVYTHRCLYMHVYICIYLYVYICIYICKYVYI